MARPLRKELTPRQREILDWVKGFIADNGMPPTIREVATAFGFQVASARDFLNALQRKGYLERRRGARALVVKGVSHAHRSSGLPIVGRITAGSLVEAFEHDRGMLSSGAEMLRGHADFALEVAGDSMIDAGILDGDYVIVRRQETAEGGDIVVALAGNETTLKRFYREKDGVRLVPANSRMSPIHVRSGEFRIQGKVVGVLCLLERSAVKHTF